jgi:hypothetical protein
MVSERVLKTISILSFVLITVSIALIYNSQAVGYEASIYENTPLLAWISLILSMGCGIYLAISSLFGRGANSRFAILGVSIAGFSTVVILLVFALRGYYLLNVSGDIGTRTAQQVRAKKQCKCRCECPLREALVWSSSCPLVLVRYIK